MDLMPLQGQSSLFVGGIRRNKDHHSQHDDQITSLRQGLCRLRITIQHSHHRPCISPNSLSMGKYTEPDKHKYWRNSVRNDSRSHRSKRDKSTDHCSRMTLTRTGLEVFGQYASCAN